MSDGTVLFDPVTTIPANFVAFQASTDLTATGLIDPAFEVAVAGGPFIGPATFNLATSSIVVFTYAGLPIAGDAWRILTNPTQVFPVVPGQFLVPQSGLLVV